MERNVAVGSGVVFIIVVVNLVFITVCIFSDVVVCVILDIVAVCIVFVAVCFVFDAIVCVISVIVAVCIVFVIGACRLENLPPRRQSDRREGDEIWRLSLILPRVVQQTMPISAPSSAVGMNELQTLHSIDSTN